MKERFQNILNTRKKRRGAFFVLLAVLCVCLAGGLVVFAAGQTGVRTEVLTFPSNRHVAGFADSQTTNFILPETAPFRVSLDLPKSMTLREAEDGDSSYAALLYSPVDIYRGDQLIGTIAYNTFTYYPEAEENPDTFHVSVYNSLMLGSVVNWNFDYTPVRQTDTSCTATCYVNIGLLDEYPGMCNAEVPRKNDPAILAYDKDLLVYVGIEFEEGSLTDSEWLAIAESLRIEAM